jgi:hypothetical protein
MREGGGGSHLNHHLSKVFEWSEHDVVLWLQRGGGKSTESAARVTEKEVKAKP